MKDQNNLKIVIFRCDTILSPRSTWLVSYNWHYGIYKKATIFTQNATDNMLWWCSADEVIGFARQDGQIDNTFSDIFHTGSYIGGYVCKFVLWKNFIICGYTYISNWHICVIIFYFCYIILCKTPQGWYSKLLFEKIWQMSPRKEAPE